MYSPSDKHILVMADNLKTRVSLMLSHFYVSRISFFFFCESMVPLVYLMQNICSHWCRDDNLILIKQKSTGIRVLSSSSVKSPPPPKKSGNLDFPCGQKFLMKCKTFWRSYSCVYSWMFSSLWDATGMFATTDSTYACKSPSESDSALSLKGWMCVDKN